ncbi:MAG: hypothetical protein K9K65_03575 [Desulfarculaceae bacterium]|nr:hypothetical protein [Desulfarculaceae bacterium]MCF8121656.1 hypothetical protein [Desulfarculaceae bacterium]
MAACLLAPVMAHAEAEPRPWRDEPSLRVNRSPAYRAVVRAYMARGEAQMRALCAKPDFEEIWAYLPGQKLWVELGCCERTTRDGNYIGIEVYVYGLLKKYDDLAIYHIHPKTAFIRDTYHADKRLIKTVEEALPSAQDINAAELLSRRFWAEHPSGRIVWRIVSRHGVTTYGLTPAGRAVKEVSAQAFLFDPLDAEELAESPALAQPTTPGPEVNRLIAQAVKRLNSDQVFVRFRPFE